MFLKALNAVAVSAPILLGSPDLPNAIQVRRMLSDSGADRLHNELLAFVFGKSWTRFAMPCWVSGSYAVSK
jgi:hypothetical protein